MGRSCGVIVPVGVDGSPAVPVGMDMPCQDNRVTAQGRIKRVILRCRFMLVLMPVNVPVLVVAMVMFGKLGLVPVRMAAMLDDDRNPKLVRLRNLRNRFPVASTVR